MTREQIKHMIYGVLLAPVLYAGLYGCLAITEPVNQAVIEWKNK